MHAVDERDVKVTSVMTAQQEHALVDDTAGMDERVLVALGYKQEFKRLLSEIIWLSTNVLISQQRLLDMGILWSLVLRLRTSAFRSINHRVQLGLLWHRRSSLGLACGRSNDQCDRVQYGRTLQ
jgi:hypothetical protein